MSTIGRREFRSRIYSDILSICPTKQKHWLLLTIKLWVHHVLKWNHSSLQIKVTRNPSLSEPVNCPQMSVLFPSTFAGFFSSALSQTIGRLGTNVRIPVLFLFFESNLSNESIELVHKTENGLANWSIFSWVWLNPERLLKW